jgi:hypothetical protein
MSDTTEKTIDIEAYAASRHPRLKFDSMSAECGPGWNRILADLVDRMAGVLGGKPGTSLSFTQVKEKYGTLRVYWTIEGGEVGKRRYKMLDGLVEGAEARSGATCEMCGRAGRLRGKGWVFTACDDHSRGEPAIGSGTGEFERSQSVGSWEGGRTLVEQCRYDAAKGRIVVTDRRIVRRR